jgi:hypothetical protein
MKTKIIWSTLLGLLSLYTLQSSAAIYTGQPLFQGVFFGVGPVAQLVPELYQQTVPTNQLPANVTLIVSNLTAQAGILNSNGYPADATKLLRLAQRMSSLPTNTPPATLDSSVQSNIMAQIALSDPTFFGRFATNMQSGNEVFVSASVKEGADRLWQYIDTVGDSTFKNNFAYCLNNVQSLDRLGEDEVVVVYYAVAVAIAAVVVVAAFWIPASPGAGLFSFEDKISLLTARLNAAGPQAVPTVSEWGMIILIFAVLAIGIFAIVKMQQKRPHD